MCTGTLLGRSSWRLLLNTMDMCACVAVCGCDDDMAWELGEGEEKGERVCTSN